jgi:FKBP12-rapamycin complex-associated protein
MWQFALEPLDEEVIPRILASLKAATDNDPSWHRAWHSWALVNFEVITHYENNYISPERIDQHLVPAIKGFFNSIALGPSTGSLQDTLRLLTLWFKYGHQRDVEKALSSGFSKVRIDVWLQVIPQIIARIAAPAPTVRKLIYELLVSVAKEHPQALVFPLMLSLQSHSPEREAAAQRVLQAVKKQHARLIDEALLVSSELVRAAISWNETWHEALEEASRLHFAEHKPDDAMKLLEPMHAMLEKGCQTLAEEAFMRNCGRDLREASEWLQRCKHSGEYSDFHQAWDLYYAVFKKTKQSIAQLDKIQLEYLAPQLTRARDLELAVPGTYRAGKPVIRLASFNPTLTILSSKQRPRKLLMNGSDGAEFVFLLKGHEDLRQDERVMQLFGLVNTLLGAEFETSRDNLSIQRYSVVPLAPNSGLIGWVPHTDTLNSLIRGYREARKIPTTNEHRALLTMAPDYANLVKWRE